MQLPEPLRVEEWTLLLPSPSITSYGICPSIGSDPKFPLSIYLALGDTDIDIVSTMLP
jgi:hypothetical protein